MRYEQLQEFAMKKDWLILFLCGIFLAIFLINGKSDKANIEDVLAQYIQIIQEETAKLGLVETLWDSSDFAHRTLKRIQSIDVSACPKDFQIAFEKHVQAWRKYQNVAEKWGGFSGFLRGFISGGFAIIECLDESSDMTRDFKYTLQEVCNIAQKYGVK